MSSPLAIVAAVAENGVIGRDNQLIWRLKSDLRRFREITWGKPMIMGRKTFRVDRQAAARARDGRPHPRPGLLGRRRRGCPRLGRSRRRREQARRGHGRRRRSSSPAGPRSTRSRSPRPTGSTSPWSTRRLRATPCSRLTSAARSGKSAAAAIRRDRTTSTPSPSSTSSAGAPHRRQPAAAGNRADPVDAACHRNHVRALTGGPDTTDNPFNHQNDHGPAGDDRPWPGKRRFFGKRTGLRCLGVTKAAAAAGVDPGATAARAAAALGARVPRAEAAARRRSRRHPPPRPGPAQGPHPRRRLDGRQGARRASSLGAVVDLAPDRLLHRAAERGRHQHDLRRLHRQDRGGAALQSALPDRPGGEADVTAVRTIPIGYRPAAGRRAAPATCSTKA